MKIEETHACNTLNLALLARYLRCEPAELLSYYDEILADRAFLDEVNARMQAVRRTHGFTKGIFHMERIDSVDWFAFERILLYVIVRHRRPARVLETGVYYGGNTAFVLRALDRNGAGELTSIDLPDSAIRAMAKPAERHPMVGDGELYTANLRPGFMIPDVLREHWTLVEGDSHDVIPTLTGRFDFYLHDSDHAMAFMLREMTLAQAVMQPDGLMLADDVDWSNAFHAFVVENHLYPLFLTDNGKDDLRVRMGLIDLAHPWARLRAITGAEPALPLAAANGGAR